MEFEVGKGLYLDEFELDKMLLLRCWTLCYGRHLNRKLVKRMKEVRSANIRSVILKGRPDNDEGWDLMYFGRGAGGKTAYRWYMKPDTAPIRWHSLRQKQTIEFIERHTAIHLPPPLWVTDLLYYDVREGFYRWGLSAYANEVEVDLGMRFRAGVPYIKNEDRRDDFEVES